MDGGLDQGRRCKREQKEEKLLFLKDAKAGWVPRAGLVDGGFREAGQGLGGGCKGFGSGGVSGRDTGCRDGANFATCVVFLLFLTRTKRRKMVFLKDALWGGGGGYPPELAWWTGG